MRHRQASSPGSSNRPAIGAFDPFQDEPATELMEMPRGAPVALVELGADDLEPWDDEPPPVRRVPRGPAPGVGARASQVVTAPIPEITAPLPEPEPSLPAPLPVLFGGRKTPSRPFAAQALRDSAAPESRQRWVASAVALATAWGVLLLLGVCVTLAVLARAGV